MQEKLLSGIKQKQKPTVSLLIFLKQVYNMRKKCQFIEKQMKETCKLMLTIYYFVCVFYDLFTAITFVSQGHLKPLYYLKLINTQ